jgi:outer membrane immunogenic protein
MRKMLLAGATASLVLGAVQAQAADMAVKARPYAAPVAAFTWSGAYVGGNVGGIWGQHRDDVAGVLISGTGADCAFATSCGISNSSGWSSSIIGGIETGYRFQHGIWVLGFEQDIRWTNLRNTFTVGAPTPAGAFVAGDTFTNRVNWLADTRVSAGLAFDRTLLFVAGGLATASMDTSAAFVAVPGGPVVAGIDDAHKYHFGYTIGGGAQYAFTDNVSLGVEYRYTKLNNESYNLGTVIGPGASVRPVFANVDFRSSEILGRLDIKFNYLTGLFGLGAL